MARTGSTFTIALVSMVVHANAGALRQLATARPPEVDTTSGGTVGTLATAPHCWGGTERTAPICLDSYTVANGNITFAVTCNPLNIIVTFPVQWCAFAIQTANTTAMYPAEAFWVGVDTAGSVFVEDRIITAKSQPPCAPTQITSLVSGSTNATTGSVHAVFTRPLQVPAAAAGQGYAAIVNAPVQVVAAAATGSRQSTRCAGGAAKHYDHYGGPAFNFAA